MLFPLQRLLPVSAALLGFGILACTPSQSVRAAVKPEKDRKAAPEFELKDAHGRTAKMSEYKGKVVLLNFWATWCGPCKIEIPWFVDLEQRYKDRGFAVLGVSMDEEGWEIVKPYIEARKMNYRVVIGTDEVADLYGGVDSLPTSFIIDQQGKIAGVHVGLVSKNVYENEIKQLLDSKASDSKSAVSATVGDSAAGSR
jgi:cytochrome c biogenesis protein CcmG/thiol:disulfide interchange protein DsbE